MSFQVAINLPPACQAVDATLTFYRWKPESGACSTQANHSLPTCCLQTTSDRSAIQFCPDLEPLSVRQTQEALVADYETQADRAYAGLLHLRYTDDSSDTYCKTDIIYSKSLNKAAKVQQESFERNQLRGNWRDCFFSPITTVTVTPNIIRSDSKKPNEPEKVTQFFCSINWSAMTRHKTTLELFGLS